MRVKRKVVSYRIYKHMSCPNDALGTRVLLLECGHSNARKASIKVPEWCYCRECEYGQNNKAADQST